MEPNGAKWSINGTKYDYEKIDRMFKGNNVHNNNTK